MKPQSEREDISVLKYLSNFIRFKNFVKLMMSKQHRKSVNFSTFSCLSNQRIQNGETITQNKGIYRQFFSKRIRGDITTLRANIDDFPYNRDFPYNPYNRGL